MVARFEIAEQEVPGLLVIRPQPRRDERGWFMRSYSVAEFAAAGIDHASLIEENHSRSSRGVLRGLHTRSERREAKLVRVVRGRVFDVVVDLRPGSPTFLQWRSFVLDDADHVQIRIPAGCAHGFQALSDEADVCYKVDAPYDPDHDAAVAWNDPDLAIPWPLPDPILSERDRNAPGLVELRPHLTDWFGTHGA